MENHMDKVSYIIGRQIGGDFSSQGIEVTKEAFIKGFETAMTGVDSEISAEETQSIMNAFQVEMQAKAQKLAAESSLVNVKAGEEYLAANKAKDGVEVTASGLQYSVLTEGSGATPTAEQTVEVHYEGTLTDGTVFDSSYQRNQTTSFPVNGVIPGWTEALQLMKEGDVWNLTIPSNLAYGERGAGGMIGPNAVLNFKVELIKVVS
jgi:FKBP-type peptidyl-prolyl cis-trans isomerase FklB